MTLQRKKNKERRDLGDKPAYSNIRLSDESSPIGKKAEREGSRYKPSHDGGKNDGSKSKGGLRRPQKTV